MVVVAVVVVGRGGWGGFSGESQLCCCPPHPETAVLLDNCGVSNTCRDQIRMEERRRDGAMEEREGILLERTSICACVGHKRGRGDKGLAEEGRRVRGGAAGGCGGRRNCDGEEKGRNRGEGQETVGGSDGK